MVRGHLKHSAQAAHGFLVVTGSVLGVAQPEKNRRTVAAAGVFQLKLLEGRSCGREFAFAQNSQSRFESTDLGRQCFDIPTIYIDLRGFNAPNARLNPRAHVVDIALHLADVAAHTIDGHLQIGLATLHVLQTALHPGHKVDHLLVFAAQLGQLSAQGFQLIGQFQQASPKLRLLVGSLGHGTAHELHGFLLLPGLRL